MTNTRNNCLVHVDGGHILSEGIVSACVGVGSVGSAVGSVNEGVY